MDPINALKGYGKVNDLEDQNQPPNRNTHHKSLSAVSISAILLLTLTVGLIVGALIYESYTEAPESSSLSSYWAEPIKVVCNVTRYPDSCFSSITSIINYPESDPEAIFMVSLKISITGLSNVSSVVKDLASKSISGPALTDCESQIEDALSRLNDSVSEMHVPPGQKMLTETKISDIQTWISSAITDHETCLDGLEEMSLTALDEIKSKIKKSEEYVSNSLAIVANIHTLLRKFHMSLH